VRTSLARVPRRKPLRKLEQPRVKRVQRFLKVAETRLFGGTHVQAFEHAPTAMTRARDARSPIRLVLTLSLASVFAALLLCANAAGGTTPSVNSSELAGQAAQTSVAVGDLAHSATERIMHPGSVPEALRTGRRAPARRSASRRSARRNTRAARHDGAVQLALLLPFVLLTSTGAAVSAAVYRWIPVSDLRLPATRGPPSTSMRILTPKNRRGPAGGRSLPEGKSSLKGHGATLAPQWDAP
jgi:hypothetical protein